MVRARAGGRLDRVCVGHQHSVAVAVGACQLSEHERSFAAFGAEPRGSRSDLVGVHSDHATPRAKQPLDPQAIRALDRDRLDHARVPRIDPTHVTPIATAIQNPPIPINHVVCSGRVAKK
jgi:hypothetical protein